MGKTSLPHFSVINIVNKETMTTTITIQDSNLYSFLILCILDKSIPELYTNKLEKMYDKYFNAPEGFEDAYSRSEYDKAVYRYVPSEQYLFLSNKGYSEMAYIDEFDEDAEVEFEIKNDKIKLLSSPGDWTIYEEDDMFDLNDAGLERFSGGTLLDIFKEYFTLECDLKEIEKAIKHYKPEGVEESFNQTFYSVLHLKQGDDLRGTASIIDTGLFDFKMK